MTKCLKVKNWFCAIWAEGWISLWTLAQIWGWGAGAGCSEKKPSSKGKHELYAWLAEANH